MGTLGMRCEYTLDRMPVQHRAPFTHTHTLLPRGSLESPVHFWESFWRKPENPKESHTDTGRTYGTTPLRLIILGIYKVAFLGGDY